MWKSCSCCLLTAIAILVAQLVSDAPVIQTRVGAAIRCRCLRVCRGEGVDRSSC